MKAIHYAADGTRLGTIEVRLFSQGQRTELRFPPDFVLGPGESVAVDWPPEEPDRHPDVMRYPDLNRG
jgi:hypothetical protein